MDKLTALLIESTCEIGNKIINYGESNIAWQVANNANNALALLDSSTFDLVLINVELCDDRASDLCKKIRSNQEELYTSIVYLSSKTHLESRLKAYTAGADDYVIKSSSLLELQHKINICINHQNHQRTLIGSYESRHLEFLRENFDVTEDNATLLSVYKNCLTAQSIEQLAHVLQSKLDGLQLAYSLQITTEQDLFRCKYDGSEFSPMEIDLFTSLRANSSKIQNFGHKSYFQHHDVELVIHNMPIEDAEKYGRLKDLLHLIITVINDQNKTLNILLLARNRCADMLTYIEDNKLAEARDSLLALQGILAVPAIEELDALSDDFIYF
ncbi:MAG: response regulator [Psychromonas sp.]|nr:response regulator [Alteromonadales bacterium]MCP5078250.1 response regulator [Psychromonas sp.]